MWLRRPKRKLSDFGFQAVSGYADDPAVQAQVAQNAKAYQSYNAAKKADARKQFLQAGLTGAAVVGAPAAVGAIGGAAGAGAGATGSLAPISGGAPWAVTPYAAPVAASGTAASTAGAGMTLGKMWDIGNLGLQGASAFFGQRSQNRALDRQMQMQQREIEMRLAADAEARAEAKRQFDAQQANETRRFAADDEDRAFNRRLLEEREARMAPYRVSADRARQRLAAFLGLG